MGWKMSGKLTALNWTPGTRYWLGSRRMAAGYTRSAQPRSEPWSCARHHREGQEERCGPCSRSRIATVWRLCARPGRVERGAFATPPTAAALAEAGVKAKAVEASPDKVADYDLVAANVSSFAPQVGARSVPLDEAIEMIDVGGSCPDRCRRPQLRVGRGCVSHPRHYPQLARGAARAGQPLGRVSPAPGRRRAGRRRGVLRRGRRLPQPHRRHALPECLAIVVEKVRDLAYGENPQQHAAFYRETMHRYGLARRRTAVPGQPADAQRPARPGRRLPHRDRLHRADLLHRQADQPDRPRVR